MLSRIFNTAYTRDYRLDALVIKKSFTWEVTQNVQCKESYLFFIFTEIERKGLTGSLDAVYRLVVFK